jgi:hypothetical protein
MEEEEKEEFKDMHCMAVDKYEKQVEEVKRNGYYIMDDGMKSNEMISSGMKRKASESK